MAKKGTTSHYSKKPMTSKELTKRGGFLREDVLDSYRKNPDLRPEHAKRNPKSGKRWQ